MLLHLEEYAIRKTPHSRTPTAPVDDRELQWTFRDCLNRGLDRQPKRSPSSGRMLSYHARASIVGEPESRTSALAVNFRKVLRLR